MKLRGDGMRSLSSITGDYLASKSSRRQFMKFLGTASLGTGLALSGTDIAAGQVLLCAGCGGFPCNPCASPHPKCRDEGFACMSCGAGGGCGPNCVTSGEWYCCTTVGDCVRRCSECNCGSATDRTCCHCFVRLGVRCGPNATMEADPIGCTCGEE